ncbi:hypothetical protein [Bradyrhizobium iriomotense]|uniref:Oligosaccharide repeat unit polymerase n=1 Tax=Bradyrhizobium iriomotense TaxID=441950 RepID=A0ABQ6AVL3_9BRAD|nr:hypothetical protein [Bradyrhizobium iriomotense]GLR85455.1 hypothetical protein GCM10007857_21660 [Bradyrhizobium iriomotense]
MASVPGIISDVRSRLESRPGLTVLVALHSAVTCLSLIKVANYQFYIFFNEERMWLAVTIALCFSTVSLLFVAARFSFGYFAGFYLYTMILGFLWIDTFSKYNYDRMAAGISAGLSLVLFLIPALFIRAPIRQVVAISDKNFERLINLVLAISAATIAVASSYNFKLVSIGQIYDYRNELEFPAAIRYLLGMTSSTLLPFVFACCWLRGYRWRALIVLLLLLLLYPITLTKFAFFTPAWLVVLVILARLFETRTSVILSLFLPILAGLIAISMTKTSLGESLAGRYFDVVNIRMIATPSSALDIYNEYFSYHPLTWFCHVSFLKTVTHCPYQDPLSIVMQNTYGFGNLNASLFATEGIASVGPYLAPLTALISGLVLALGNRASAGLPDRFVLVSGGILPHILLNVPLTVALLTHGTVVLFLLWYVMPRSYFERTK